MTTQIVAPSPCSLHRQHAPRNLTVEWHHVIPVAWQLHTTSPNPPPSPGPDTSGRGMLWDDRGIWVCPTGHRNVHYWIVALMHAAAKAQSNDPIAAWAAVKPHRSVSVELYIALDALTRFVAEAPEMPLLSLTAMDEWGQA